jgi:hypothetical protein
MLESLDTHLAELDHLHDDLSRALDDWVMSTEEEDEERYTIHETNTKNFGREDVKFIKELHMMEMENASKKKDKDVKNDPHEAVGEQLMMIHTFRYSHVYASIILILHDIVYVYLSLLPLPLSV